MEESIRCPDCGGVGYHADEVNHLYDRLVVWFKCVWCDGRGRVPEDIYDWYWRTQLIRYRVHTHPYLWEN
jgi:hypothetical protein